MEKVVLDVPALWADHHTLKVRDALVPLGGVEEVYASAAWKQVLVTFDPKKIKPAAIEKALADAGYPVGAEEAPALTQPTENRKDPKWLALDMRMAETNEAERDLDSEFRRQ
jgi:copper chaperone CopZ